MIMAVAKESHQQDESLMMMMVADNHPQLDDDRHLVAANDHLANHDVPAADSAPAANDEMVMLAKTHHVGRQKSIISPPSRSARPFQDHNHHGLNQNHNHLHHHHHHHHRHHSHQNQNQHQHQHQHQLQPDIISCGGQQIIADHQATTRMQEQTATSNKIKLEQQIDDDHHHHNNNNNNSTTANTIIGGSTQTTPISNNCCASCRKPIRDRFMFSVIEQNFHKDCVRCCDCSSSLQDRCFALEGKLYCRIDYWRRFGPKCSACQEVIKPTELVQKLKQNLVYHLNCFYCQDCKRHLQTGEQLHLIDDRRLLCSRDFLLNNAYHHHNRIGDDILVANNNSQQQQPLMIQTNNKTSTIKQQQDENYLQQQQQQPGQLTDNLHNQHSPLLSLSGVVESVDVVRSSSARQNKGTASKQLLQVTGKLVTPSSTSSSSSSSSSASSSASSLSSTSSPSLTTPEAKKSQTSSTVIWGQGACKHSTSRSSNKQAFPATATNQEHTTSTGRIDGRRGPKRPRTILTTSQRKAFRSSFDLSQKPCRKVREALAKETGLSVRIVQVWFQNQRAKLKKMQRKQMPTNQQHSQQQQQQQQQMHNPAHQISGSTGQQLMACSSLGSAAGNSSHLISMAHLQQQQQHQSFSSASSLVSGGPTCPSPNGSMQTIYHRPPLHPNSQLSPSLAPPMSNQLHLQQPQQPIMTQQRRQRQQQALTMTGQAATSATTDDFPANDNSKLLAPPNNSSASNNQGRQRTSHRTINESEGELSRSVSELEMSDEEEDEEEEEEEEDEDGMDDDEDEEEEEEDESNVEDGDDDNDDDMEEDIERNNEPEDLNGGEADERRGGNRGQADDNNDCKEDAGADNGDGDGDGDGDDDGENRLTENSSAKKGDGFESSEAARSHSGRAPKMIRSHRQGNTTINKRRVSSGNNQSLLREQQPLETAFLGNNQMDQQQQPHTNQFLLKMQTFATTNN